MTPLVIFHCSLELTFDGEKSSLIVLTIQYLSLIDIPEDLKIKPCNFTDDIKAIIGFLIIQLNALVIPPLKFYLLASLICVCVSCIVVSFHFNNADSATD